ncbi:unnamed protein product [Urochloa humidicola]
MRILAFIIITVAVVSYNHVCAMDSHAADRAALLSFKSGVQGNLSDWSSVSRTCDWTGVACDLRGRVIILILSYHNLTGVISPAIGNLSALEILGLGGNGNRLSGNLPPELGKLSRLVALDLEDNLLEGAIPHRSTLGLLELSRLSLNGNNLSGDIPEALFRNGSFLVNIDLSGNSLSGVIPLSIRCRLLVNLGLSGNRLVGVIPTSISNLTSLENMILFNNFLDGVLPSPMFSKMTSLVELQLGYNNFSSDDENTNLEPFFASLVNCTGLQLLGLEANGFGGKIPPIFGNLTLRAIEQNDYRISGSPIEVDLSINKLKGPIPSEIFHLQRIIALNLSHNQISGEIPKSIGRAQELRYIDVSYNDLEGPIPETLSNLTELEELVLGNNRISGEIPKSIGLAEGLCSIDLSYNCLHGVMPDTLSNLTNLQHLVLNDNQLSGNIAPRLS